MLDILQGQTQCSRSGKLLFRPYCIRVLGYWGFADWSATGGQSLDSEHYEDFPPSSDGLSSSMAAVFF